MTASIRSLVYQKQSLGVLRGNQLLNRLLRINSPWSMNSTNTCMILGARVNDPANQIPRLYQEYYQPPINDSTPPIQFLSFNQESWKYIYLTGTPTRRPALFALHFAPRASCVIAYVGRCAWPG